MVTSAMWSLADLRSMAASSARGCCAWSAHTDRILSAVRKVVSACDELWWESWSAGCADCEKAEADRKEPHRPGAGKAEVMVGGGTDDGDVVAGAPARRLRPRWPSLSRWPTTGAMPARRLISLRMVGVTPRLWRKTMPQLLLASWSRSPRRQRRARRTRRSIARRGRPGRPECGR